MRSNERLTETFKALSHPIRQEIICILAEYQKIGFTALQNELNNSTTNQKTIQVGTIYHHIKLLGDLVDQDSSSKSWVLSEKGWFAHNLLNSSQDRNQFLQQGDMAKPTPLSFIWHIIAPPELYFFIKKSLFLFIGWLIIFFSLFAFLMAQNNLVLIFMFFNDLNDQKNFFFSLFSILLSWMFFTGTVLILSKQLLRGRRLSKEDIFTISVFLGICLLPLSIFPFLVSLNLVKLNQQYLPLSIAVVLQLWVIILTARAISVHFFVRMERASIISLIATYIMVLLGLIISF